MKEKRDENTENQNLNTGKAGAAGATSAEGKSGAAASAESGMHIEQKITDTIVENYMPYVMSVIVSRAIPEIDGFKPSHRKILYTMYKMKLLGGTRTKSANVVGQTMKLNPHGDQAIYATMVRLASGNESLILPYIDSKGNFGKVTSRDMKYAAPRYTEVRLQAICEAIFRDIDKNTVDMADNYDETTKEPVLLPTVFPNILANPNTGIAVGMASNIPSFNLAELCAATSALIEDPDVDLLKHMPAPDFSTGGEILYNKAKMRDIYNTGQGSVRIRGKLEYDKKNNIILITEIPYTTTVEQIIDKTIDLVKSGRIKGIVDVRDETDLKGLKIALDLRRGADWELVAAKLFKLTPLTSSFGCNINVLIGSDPAVMGIKQLLNHWLDFRRQCIKRATQFDIEKLNNQLHLLQGLEKMLLDIDRAIAIIRGTETDSEVVPNIEKAFGLTKLQAQYVVEIKLRNLNKDYIINKTRDIENLEKTLKSMRQLLGSDDLINQRIITELAEISKKYGQERKTRLVSEEKAESKMPDITPTIDDFNLKVFITDHGYLKKVPLTSLRASGDHKTKDDDHLVQEIEATNTEELLFFTDRADVYKMYLHEIPEHRVSELGDYLPNLLEMDDGENVVYVANAGDFTGHMLFAFENGKAAKTPLAAYQTKQNRRKLVKAYSDASPLVRAIYLPEDQDLVFIRQGAGSIRGLMINTSLIAEKVTRGSVGVQVLRLAKGTSLAGFIPADAYDLKDQESMKRDRIPGSGKNLEPEDAMTMDKWIKS